jgi:hypothetical protein
LRILELQQRELPVNQGRLETHHIIPCSAGGLNRRFNEIRVTEYEHWELHSLRLEAYNEIADAFVFHFC